MSQAQWTAVDDYITSMFCPPDAALEAALQAATDAGMPAINVAPNQGKLLQVLALAIGARRILEIGTLAGYSTIWLARALPVDGHLLTLELSPQHARVATANLERAGLSAITEVRVGPALESLLKLASEQQQPFDLVFIDADKQSAKEYFDWALQLTRPGGLIITDNVVRDGAVINTESADSSVQGIRRLNEAVRGQTGVSATAIQTVGSKGYDGLMIAVVGQKQVSGVGNQQSGISGLAAFTS
jgi:predicted O-methyltransferase YrrM